MLKKVEYLLRRIKYIRELLPAWIGSCGWRPRQPGRVPEGYDNFIIIIISDSATKKWSFCSDIRYGSHAIVIRVPFCVVKLQIEFSPPTTETNYRKLSLIVVS